MKPNRTKYQNGFTLIELIVIVAMMVIVSTALVANFREGEKQKRVNLARDMVINAIRTAQNYTLSGKQIPTANVTTARGTRCGSNNSADSYWVEFTNANTFYLMAQDKCAAVIRVETYKLVGQTRFTQSNGFTITDSNGTSNSNRLAIRFLPPFAIMSITNAQNPGSSSFSNFIKGQVKIEYQDGQRQTAVEVDGVSGQIQ